MKIIVFGASGKTGHHLVSQAVDKGYFVTAFARHSDKIKLQHSNLKIIRGNVTDFLLQLVHYNNYIRKKPWIMY